MGLCVEAQVSEDIRFLMAKGLNVMWWAVWSPARYLVFALSYSSRGNHRLSIDSMVHCLGTRAPKRTGEYATVQLN